MVVESDEEESEEDEEGEGVWRASQAWITRQRRIVVPMLVPAKLQRTTERNPMPPMAPMVPVYRGRRKREEEGGTGLVVGFGGFSLVGFLFSVWGSRGLFFFVCLPF